MANKSGKTAVTDDDLARLRAVLPEHTNPDGSVNKSAISRDLGISRQAVGNHLKKLEERPDKPELEHPVFPESDVSIERIIDLQCERIEKRKASYDAHTWYEVKVRDPGPIGVLWFGDPHVDDNGCDWPTLKRHIAICKNTPRLYGANIGDTTNNWAGRLQRLYAEQDASLKTARRLAKWFMLDSGIDWLVWLIGNHDAWGDGHEILSLIGAPRIVMHDWEARFCLVWPDGEKIRIYASHDFKGHSQWNPGHGPMKEAQMGDDADLFVAGHKHNWFCSFWENAKRGGTVPTIVRNRGYKILDDFARRNGFAEQETGASCLTLFRPYAEDPAGRIIPFYDIEFGAEVLKQEIKRYDRQRSGKAA